MCGADQLRLDVAAEPPLELTGDDDQVLYFGGRRRSGTWIVSGFVVVHLIVFLATMAVNNCPVRSAGDCALPFLGRFSFQLLSENPLIGPSSSTLVKMGAMERKFTIQQHQSWRLLTYLWLHSGVIHLVVNLLSTFFVGIHLEQDFGPLRIGVIYVLSALLGSLASAIFVQHIPAVGSSGSLFGLLGASFAGLVQNWQICSDKVWALAVLVVVSAINFSLGLLPHVDNYSNIGGFAAGVLLGFTVLYNIKLSVLERKKCIFEYGVKSSVKWRQKFDKPASRIIAYLLFTVILVGGLLAVIQGVDANACCSWCQYIDCVPTKLWSCNQKAISCEGLVSDGRLTLKCVDGMKFRTYPSANVSPERMGDVCTLLCS